MAKDEHNYWKDNTVTSLPGVYEQWDKLAFFENSIWWLLKNQIIFNKLMWDPTRHWLL